MQMEIGLGKLFNGISVSGDTQFSAGKRGKNKDCFDNKQFFFKSLFCLRGAAPGEAPEIRGGAPGRGPEIRGGAPGRGPEIRGGAPRGTPKMLLDKGFKFPNCSLEGFFLFSVEPPFRRGFFHQRVDVAHPHQVPDAF